MKVQARVIMNEAPIEGVSKKSGKPYKVYKLNVNWTEETKSGNTKQWVQASCMQKLDELRIKEHMHSDEYIDVMLWFDIRESTKEPGRYYNEIHVTLPEAYCLRDEK